MQLPLSQPEQLTDALCAVRSESEAPPLGTRQSSQSTVEVMTMSLYLGQPWAFLTAVLLGKSHAPNRRAFFGLETAELDLGVVDEDHRVSDLAVACHRQIADSMVFIDYSEVELGRLEAEER